MMRCLLLACWLAGAGSALADPLPDPLSLEHALALAAQEHPALQAQLAEEAAARAGLLAAQAEDGAQLSLTGRLRWVDPSPAAVDQSSEDHQVGLRLSKTLYDFGRSSGREGAASQRLAAAEHLSSDTRAQRRALVLQAFCAVWLADLQYARDNEAMAVAYVDVDKKRERHRLGQISDLELARLENLYQQSLDQRKQSETQQRVTRARLANALNRPGQLPANLVPPVFPQRPLPALETLQKQAADNNPGLQAQRAQLDAAQQAVSAARAEKWPRVSLVAEANQWDKDFGSRDRAYGGIELEVPLYTGGRASAALAQALAEVELRRARLAEQEMAVSQAVLETGLSLQTLYSRREAVKAGERYQEKRLDQQRTLYEMEYAADLGDAMIGQSEIKLAGARNECAIAVAWAELEAWVGGELAADKQGTD